MPTSSSRISGANRFPLLGKLVAGKVQRHEVVLPGEALKEDRWPVITVSGTRSGPVVFVNAGAHGAEYPAIETVLQLARSLDPEHISGTVVLMPVVNLPAFRNRTMFVCPVDGLNPNRVFPGNDSGSYTEQLVYGLTTQFIQHADAYIDLHGGDMVEDLAPFSICRDGDDDVDVASKSLAIAFGLPSLLTIDRPVQSSNGSMSFVAAAERGVPGFIAEAGGVGQLQQEAVALLYAGVLRVMAHLGMIDEVVAEVSPPAILRSFEWLYTKSAGMFYSEVKAGDVVERGQNVGRMGSLFGDTIEEVVSPLNGRVLFLTTSPAMNAESLLMGIGVE